MFTEKRFGVSVLIKFKLYFNFIGKKLQHRYFSVKIAKNNFFVEHVRAAAFID